jgi:phenylpropionate dioxygenase-like ring-hydroxylating dioxygenase large terminal subunit
VISAQEADELTRVGPQTPAGAFLRQFWLPFLPSDAVAPGGEPFPVRLLGEDLIAFRREDGRVGLVDTACAHRRAPLLYARNEGCGLRCVYHGWQFDTDGQCTDMPAEPATSRFKQHIKIKAYPVRERNGVLWTFMGTPLVATGEPPELPELPDLEWNLVPAQNVHVSFRVQETDWLSAYEGEIDSAHAPILHGRLDSTSKRSNTMAARTGRPIFDVVQQDFGVSVGARRPIGDGAELYWRVNQFVLPFYTLVPPKSAEWAELTGHAWVPIDDTHTLCVGFTYLPDQPLKERMVDVFVNSYKGRETGHPSRLAYDETIPHNEPYWKFISRYRRATNFMFDYELQRETYFSGLPGLWVQDSGTQSGASYLAPRSHEHLTSSDVGLVVARQTVRDCVEGYRASGQLPAIAARPDLYHVRSVAAVLKRDESWTEALEGFVRRFGGAPLGYEIP